MNLRPLALVAAAAGLAGALTSPMPTATALSGFTAPDALSTGAVQHRAIGATYRFSSVLDAKPVRWNPCAAIHWRFRAANAPRGGEAVVRAAVAQVARATGTTWVQDGTTTAVPSTALLPRTMNAHRPVVIGWTDAAHSDLLRSVRGNVLGVTRTAWFGVDYGTYRVAAIQGAVIALDARDRLPLTGRASWNAVVLHELGHVMGLGHAGTSRELMYPVLSRHLSGLQAGDRAGLARLGRHAGCVVLPRLG